jgi:phosphinothricin acetyltransferase
MGYAYANTFKARAAYDWSVETTIYVKNNLRRIGIGKELYNALEKILSGMGILNMNACIAVTSKEDTHLTNDSVYFHEKMGFKLVGTFHNSGYKYNTWYDMVWMEKIIGNHTLMHTPVAFGKWTTCL